MFLMVFSTAAVSRRKIKDLYCHYASIRKNIYKVDRTQNINHICILNFFGIRTDPQAIIEQEVVLFFYVPV